MVIFRENSEDIYAGIEFEAGSDDLEQVQARNSAGRFLIDGRRSAFLTRVGIGIKPVSREEGTSNGMVKAAIQYAIENERESVTLVHKGNIMKFTEGAFRDWGYRHAPREQFGAKPKSMADPGTCVEPSPKSGAEIIVKDVIADAMLQQILTRPAEYDVIATLNLNGDYISDALAACVGGIGIAPGGNINYDHWTRHL